MVVGLYRAVADRADHAIGDDVDDRIVQVRTIIEVVPVRMDREGVPHRDGEGQAIAVLRAQSALFGTAIDADGGRWLVRPAVSDTADLSPRA